MIPIRPVNYFIESPFGFTSEIVKSLLQAVVEVVKNLWAQMVRFFKRTPNKADDRIFGTIHNVDSINNDLLNSDSANRCAHLDEKKLLDGQSQVADSINSDRVPHDLQQVGVLEDVQLSSNSKNETELEGLKIDSDAGSEEDGETDINSDLQSNGQPADAPHQKIPSQIQLIKKQKIKKKPKPTFTKVESNFSLTKDFYPELESCVKKIKYFEGIGKCLIEMDDRAKRRGADSAHLKLLKDEFYQKIFVRHPEFLGRLPDFNNFPMLLRIGLKQPNVVQYLSKTMLHKLHDELSVKTSDKSRNELWVKVHAFFDPRT